MTKAWLEARCTVGMGVAISLRRPDECITGMVYGGRMKDIIELMGVPCTTFALGGRPTARSDEAPGA